MTLFELLAAFGLVCCAALGAKIGAAYGIGWALLGAVLGAFGGIVAGALLALALIAMAHLQHLMFGEKDRGKVQFEDADHK